MAVQVTESGGAGTDRAGMCAMRVVARAMVFATIPALCVVLALSVPPAAAPARSAPSDLPPLLPSLMSEMLGRDVGVEELAGGGGSTPAETASEIAAEAVPTVDPPVEAAPEPIPAVAMAGAAPAITAESSPPVAAPPESRASPDAGPSTEASAAVDYFGNPVEEGPAPAAASPVAVPSTEAPSAPAPLPLAVPAPLPLPNVPAPDIQVSAAELLLRATDGNGVSTDTATTAVPYVVGRNCYRWSLRFAPVEGDLLLTEELRLPGPARNWTNAADSAVNPQRSIAVTPRHFDAAKGEASAGWCVAKDDPVGSYRYIIRQGDREVARLDFTVGDLL
ncbi:hypothetical protein LWE61_04225 [Sphingobium sufflavum]|uniref:hypothetical protein n=1 Tax=Sphingobium sufflavum TaxID=1129547 RepID=UPI001F1ECB45|nr:hypothetical protein [Sphingobium sufflavum]MCE7795762.1 hypothetical protein [Sphingobium sufflavum]